MKDTTKDLIGGAIALATNAITEYAVSTVVMTVLDAVVPGKFSKFARFAIKFGTSVIYENTIGDKVASSMARAVIAGSTLGENVSDIILNSENEPEEVGA